jgi:L-ascorbate metabolism protein UlaG (beta-lactamase superfamily)
MIEPVRQGRALVEEIEESCPEPGSLFVWWLGQSGYVIKSRQGLLAIDLYLSEHLTRKYQATDRPHVRMIRAPLRGGDLHHVDLILASHKHSDHLDPGSLPELMVASPNAVLVLPESIWEYAQSLGLPADRLVGLDAQESSGPGDAQPPGTDLPETTFNRAGFRVRAIPSAHEGLDTDPARRHLYLGYIIESEGRRLYHSGDSVVYDGLAEQLGSKPFDVLFLPINGRDPARGVPGNMSAAEAVDLASTVRPRFVVPHHYDMFTFNTVPVEEFAAESRRLAEGVRPWILACGQRWEIRL